MGRVLDVGPWVFWVGYPVGPIAGLVLLRRPTTAAGASCGTLSSTANCARGVAAGTTRHRALGHLRHLALKGRAMHTAVALWVHAGIARRRGPAAPAIAAVPASSALLGLCAAAKGSNSAGAAFAVCVHHAALAHGSDLAHAATRRLSHGSRSSGHSHHHHRVGPSVLRRAVAMAVARLRLHGNLHVGWHATQVWLQHHDLHVGRHALHVLHARMPLHARVPLAGLALVGVRPGGGNNTTTQHHPLHVGLDHDVTARHAGHSGLHHHHHGLRRTAVPVHVWAHAHHRVTTVWLARRTHWRALHGHVALSLLRAAGLLRATRLRAAVPRVARVAIGRAAAWAGSLRTVRHVPALLHRLHLLHGHVLHRRHLLHGLLHRLPSAASPITRDLLLRVDPRRCLHLRVLL
mmetsp:Transcript_66796/g.184990  ORF Transcript_66796/g.184990 Transcript_66796/m.184990 type:complete len:405 (-) Transcript_66796:125-1339(-)